MLITLAADSILSPIEGLQATSRTSNILRLSWAAMKEEKPFDLGAFPHHQVLKERIFAPASPCITDDSVLAFAVKSAVLKLPAEGSTPELIRQTLTQEFKEFAQKYREGVRGFGRGFEAWLANPAQKPNSNGNGALMRMQPILDLSLTHPLREPLAAIQASITHGPEAVQMARGLESAHRRASLMATSAEREDFFLYCAHKLLGADNLQRVHDEKRFVCSAKETLGLAFLVAAYSLSWEDLFDLVAWIGGDTDTLGVVAAQLATLTLGPFAQAQMIADAAMRPHPELSGLLSQALAAL